MYILENNLKKTNMKTIKITALFIFSLLLTGNLFAQSQLITVPLSDPGKTYKLDMHLLDGSIKITGYEGKDIIVDVETDSSKSHRNEETGSGMHRIDGGNSVDLTATENNNTVNISAGRSRKAVTIVVKVPQTTATFTVGTVTHGDITISNISGTMEVNNVNGSITCNNISGSLVANTVNGKVLVTFKSIDPKAAMAFSTLNGNIDVTFPAGTSANFKLKSDRGDVLTDFDMAIDKTQPKATVTNEDRMHRISIEDWIYGKINGGGPEIMMKNMQGSIYIRKAK